MQDVVYPFGDEPHLPRGEDNIVHVWHKVGAVGQRVANINTDKSVVFNWVQVNVLFEVDLELPREHCDVSF